MEIMNMFTGLVLIYLATYGMIMHELYDFYNFYRNTEKIDLVDWIGFISTILFLVGIGAVIHNWFRLIF